MRLTRETLRTAVPLLAAAAMDTALDRVPLWPPLRTVLAFSAMLAADYALLTLIGEEE